MDDANIWPTLQEAVGNKKARSIPSFLPVHSFLFPNGWYSLFADLYSDVARKSPIHGSIRDMEAGIPGIGACKKNSRKSVSNKKRITKTRCKVLLTPSKSTRDSFYPATLQRETDKIKNITQKAKQPAAQTSNTTCTRLKSGEILLANRYACLPVESFKVHDEVGAVVGEAVAQCNNGSSQMQTKSAVNKWKRKMISLLNTKHWIIKKNTSHISHREAGALEPSCFEGASLSPPSHNDTDSRVNDIVKDCTLDCGQSPQSHVTARSTCMLEKALLLVTSRLIFQSMLDCWGVMYPNSWILHQMQGTIASLVDWSIVQITCFHLIMWNTLYPVEAVLDGKLENLTKDHANVAIVFGLVMQTFSIITLDVC